MPVQEAGSSASVPRDSATITPSGAARSGAAWAGSTARAHARVYTHSCEGPACVASPRPPAAAASTMAAPTSATRPARLPDPEQSVRAIAMPAELRSGPSPRTQALRHGGAQRANRAVQVDGYGHKITASACRTHARARACARTRSHISMLCASTKACRASTKACRAPKNGFTRIGMCVTASQSRSEATLQPSATCRTTLTSWPAAELHENQRTSTKPSLRWPDLRTPQP